MRASQNPSTLAGRPFRQLGGLGLIAFAIFALWRWGLESRVTVSNPSDLTTQAELADLWFHDGSLFGAGRTGSIVTVYRWPADSPDTLALPDRRRVDLDVAAGSASASVGAGRNPELRVPAGLNPQASRLAQGAIRSTPGRQTGPESIQRPTPGPDSASGPYISFAVSRDGRRVAWIGGSPAVRLYVADLPPVPVGGDSLGAQTTDTATLKTFASPPQLGFLRSGHLAIYDPSVGVLHLRTPAKTWDRLTVPRNQVMRVLGNRIALAPTANRGPPASPEVVVVEQTAAWRTRYYRIETDAAFPSEFQQQSRLVELPVAISEAGHVALGTPSGEIIHATEDTSYQRGTGDSVLAAPGAVRAMEFLDDRRLLVAGDFRGIHLLSPGRVDQEIAPAAIGTNLLAILTDRIAYAGGGSITLGDLQTSRRPTALAVALAVSGLLLGLGALFLTKQARRLEASAEERAQLNAAAGPVPFRHPPQPPPPPPAELIQALQRGECILIAGSGLGAQAGLPTWPQFLAGLASYGKEQSLLGEASHAAVTEALANGNITAAAEELSLEVPTQAFRDYVKQMFSGGSLSPLHRALGRLPFAGVISSNFDTLLDKAFAAHDPVKVSSAEGEGKPGQGLLHVMREHRFFLLNMLGRVDQPATLSFTPRPYRDTLSRDLALRQVLRSAFERYTVFFLGLGLTAIRDFLDAIEVSASSGEAKHFALVGQDAPIEAAESRTLEKNYSIRVLGFIPQPGWPELQKFVEQADGMVRAGASERIEDRPRLTRLVLENIGPFESLDLTLNEGWNVLLGDNGVGKSVILRAIAAALSGQEAPAAAVSRLLRTGTKPGKIEVYVGETATPFVVHLSRDLDEAVQLRSPSLSPLRLGNWLVIGFPALRAMTYGPLPKRGPPALPSAADLAALMNNDADTRISDLKAWLFDLKLATTRGGPDAARAERLFMRFFEVLNEITPDAGIRFKEIDAHKRIWIEANGVAVQMEAVSQGVASVLCWVGVMLQRAYEVHTGLENPEDGPVLVLVDEIDAHMHPSWQRLIAPTLRKLFPRLQVLATTHSPMIVGTMSEEQIFKAKRENGKVVVEQSAVSPRGLRADQVLTSPLFDLGSASVDPESDKHLEDYTALVSRDPHSLSAEERARLERVTAYLHKATISVHDRYQTVQAYEVIGSAVRQQLEGMSPEQRKKIEAEVKVRLVEDSNRGAAES